MTDEKPIEPVSSNEGDDVEVASTVRTSVPAVRQKARLTFRDLFRGLADALSVPHSW